MQPSPSDRGARGLHGLAAVAALLLLAAWPRPASVAEFSGELRIREYESAVFDYRNRSLTLEQVLITHGDDIRVTAKHAVQTREQGNINRLQLSGGVYIEFRDARLEANSAVMLFRGEEFTSVQVTGSQAQFSHQPEGFPRRVQGQANAISYEPATGLVEFSGDVSYTDGCNRLEDRNLIRYDLNAGVATDDGDPATRGSITICLDRDDEDLRLPTPRQPQRDTAQ